MADLNFLFLPVGQYCIDVPTCSPDDRIVDAARYMQERDTSCLVVCEQGIPTGIVTDRDLRNKLVAQDIDPHDVRVRSVMNAPLVTISREEHILDALLRMTRRHIHHLVVLDESGRLAGLIGDSDIYRFQKQSPHLLVREIEEAVTIDELRILHLRVQDLVGYLLETGVGIQQLIRLIAHLNDQVLLRLIQIIRAARYSDMSDCFALVVLGSQGRGEQTLTTDQDTAMIYADDLPAVEVRRLAEFCCEVIDAFVAIGIPCCPGDTMASNEFWRRSSSGWQREVDSWFSSITLENIINVAMFCDMRTLYGDPALERGVKQHIESCIGHDDLFLMKMAANVHRIPIPLSWTGRIKTEQEGERQGQLDIKRGGIFTITEGVKVLALESKILDGGTLERIARLVEAGVLSTVQAENLRDAFGRLIALRLRFQVKSLREGKPLSNRIFPGQLSRMEKELLRLALDEALSFQEFLKQRYQLALMT